MMRLKIFILVLTLSLIASCLPEANNKPQFQSNFKTISQPYVEMFQAERIYVSSKYSGAENHNYSSLSLRVQNPQNFNAYFDKIEEISMRLAKSMYTHLVNKDVYQEIEIVYEDGKGYSASRNTEFFKIRFTKDEILKEINNNKVENQKN